MELEDKEFVVLENILNKINKDYISLSATDIRRNNALLLQVINKIVDVMKTKDILFKNMYQNNYYGGSFYDGLKIGQPSEYDLDCLLALPKIIEPTVEVSDKPGYVHVGLKQLKLMEKRDEAHRYVGLDKLCDGSLRLSTVKVLAWMESVMKLALNTFHTNAAGQSEIAVNAEKKTYIVLIQKVKKSGPALTLKLVGEYDHDKFELDVDLVTCFTFFKEQWPSKESGYRKNTSERRDTFFVVPKSPSKEEDTYWRLSFQEQERELIRSYSLMKPAIRLIKRLRDLYHKGIASYYIKTVFLWEVGSIEKAFWTQSLSCVFMKMLEKYADYVKNGEIPYFWNADLNLIGNLKESTYSGFANHLRRIIQEVKSNIHTDPFVIAKFLLESNAEVEALKSEVTLGKKYLKRSTSMSAVSSRSSSVEPLKAPNQHKLFSNVSSPSPPQSSFEDLTVDSVPFSPAPDATDELNVMSVFSKIVADNAKMLELCQGMVSKIELVENKMADLDYKCDRLQYMEKKINSLEEKIDGLVKNNEKLKSNSHPVAEDAVEELFTEFDRILVTSRFESPTS